MKNNDTLPIMTIDGLSVLQSANEKPKGGFLYDSDDFFGNDQEDFPLVDDALLDYEEEWLDDPKHPPSPIIIHDGKPHHPPDFPHFQPHPIPHSEVHFSTPASPPHHDEGPRIHQRLCFLPPCDPGDLRLASPTPIPTPLPPLHEPHSPNHHEHIGPHHDQHTHIGGPSAVNPIQFNQAFIPGPPHEPHELHHEPHGPHHEPHGPHHDLHGLHHEPHGPHHEPHGPHYEPHGPHDPHHVIHPVQPHQSFIPAPPHFHSSPPHPTPKIKTVYPNLIPRPRPKFLPPPERHLYGLKLTSQVPATLLPQVYSTTTTTTASTTKYPTPPQEIVTTYAPLLPRIPGNSITKSPSFYGLPYITSTHIPKHLIPSPPTPPSVVNHFAANGPIQDSLDLGALLPAIPSPPNIPTHFDVAHHGSIGLQTTQRPFGVGHYSTTSTPSPITYSTTTTTLKPHQPQLQQPLFEVSPQKASSGLSQQIIVHSTSTTTAQPLLVLFKPKR